MVKKLKIMIHKKKENTNKYGNDGANDEDNDKKDNTNENVIITGETDNEKNPWNSKLTCF